MTPAQYVEHWFGVATGWLGWTPEIAWHTPIPQIYAAQKGLLDWTRLQNGDDPYETPAQKLRKHLESLARE